MSNKFKLLWDKKYSVEKSRREKLKEVGIKNMKYYNQNIYRPMLKEIREECTKLGHCEGNYDQHYHDNGWGWSWLKCSCCHTRLRIWLNGVELMVKNGNPINNGKNWIEIDGEIGQSCVYDRVYKPSL